MLPRRLRLRAESRMFARVEIADTGSEGSTEGVIERVRRAGPRVEVRMLLSDGSEGVAQLDAHDWDWLELRYGDIVPVWRSEGFGFSA
jgi:hypothetical protein